MTALHEAPSAATDGPSLQGEQMDSAGHQHAGMLLQPVISRYDVATDLAAPPQAPRATREDVLAAAARTVPQAKPDKGSDKATASKHPNRARSLARKVMLATALGIMAFVATTAATANSLVGADVVSPAPTAQASDIAPNVYTMPTAARFGAPLCSAVIFKGTVGETATHCVTENPNNPATLVLAPNGQYYMVESAPYSTLYTGNTADKLSFAANISEMLIPLKGDVTILILNGHSVADAWRILGGSTLSLSDIDTLAAKNPNHPLVFTFMAWPGDQNYEQSALQNFTGVLVTDTYITKNDAGQPENLILVATKNNKNGANCTPGASGAEGTIPDDTAQGVQPAVAGIVVGGWKIDDPTIQAVLRAYGIDPHQFDYLCALSTNPSSTDPATAVKVVWSRKQEPTSGVSATRTSQSLIYARRPRTPTPINRLSTVVVS